MTILADGHHRSPISQMGKVKLRDFMWRKAKSDPDLPHSKASPWAAQWGPSSALSHVDRKTPLREGMASSGSSGLRNCISGDSRLRREQKPVWPSGTGTSPTRSRAISSEGGPDGRRRRDPAPPPSLLQGGSGVRRKVTRPVALVRGEPMAGWLQARVTLQSRERPVLGRAHA